MKDIEAYYHSIETFGTVDGPGIRYVLFLSGCDVGCIFCHNPDTWGRGSQTISIEQVVKEMESYRSFYENSGGGLTVSGGEPLRQISFVVKLFEAVQKRGFSTVLDTSGYVNKEVWDEILPVTDIVQFSIKAVTPQIHQMLTRVDNKIILDNLKHVANRANITLRYVVIPDITDSKKEIHQLGNLLKELPTTVSLEFLPYHDFGKEKWLKLGLQYQMDKVRKATKEDILRVKSYM